jgi:UDP-N-acetylmuramyl pentapeptide synthase
MQRGALVLITDQCYSDYPCIVSKDPIKTYARLCQYYRDLQPRVKVTAVTGSIGKTTTKNMIAEVYKTCFRTSYTEENNNTKTTVGFAVQHIPDWAEMMVQEVHEGEPNETQWISLMLHPEVAVITSIDNSHFQFFGSADKIIEECCAVTKYMSETGIVIVNKDEFTRFDLLSGRRVMTISLDDETADVYASNIELDNDGLTFIVHVKDNGTCFRVRLNSIFARHNVICALYAFTAGYCQGVPTESIIRGLSNYRTSGIRQNIIKTSGGVTLYVDCYNAVAKSMKSAIDACDSIPVSGKRIAVLGDIAEVGDLSDSMHREVISYINESKFDMLLIIGDKMKMAAEAVTNRNSLLIQSFDNRTVLSDCLRDVTAKGDLVLFKASNASNLKECVLMVWPETEPFVINKKHK